MRDPDKGERGMNPITIAIVNPQKKYWPSRGLNQRPVFKSCSPLTALWGLASSFGGRPLHKGGTIYTQFSCIFNQSASQIVLEFSHLVRLNHKIHVNHKRNNKISKNFIPDSPLPHMPILGSSSSAVRKDNNDVKNMDKWGYNFQIE